MGKKDKKKVSGAVKTAAKTEKKLESKRKKELAKLGEDDIENIVASIEREEAKRLAVVESVVREPPSPRVNATFTPHPINSHEIILFGGENHNGKKTYVYNDLFIFNINKSEWRILKSPGAPPPRSAHQTIALSSNKGELWIFGGEFTSVTETQFYHYKDLWLFNISERKWKKIESPGGPSSRSGHRMVNVRRLLGVFGGYHDNGRSYKYYNDLYIFCTDNRIWKKIDTVGIPPTPRSGCMIMPSGSNSIIVYGGYARVQDGKIDKGVTYGDLFRLTGLSNLNATDENASKANMSFRWESLKGGVYRPTPPRSSFSTCIAPGNKCYVFGGVTDIEETEEELTGELFNTLHCLDLENATWHQVNMRTQKAIKKQDDATSEDTMEVEEEEKEAPVTVCSDGVFTMTVGGASSTSNTQNANSQSNDSKNIEGPSPRMNAMIAVQKSTLYLYGGLIEKGEKQFTLSDIHTLDLHKLDGWKTIIPQENLPEWCGSDSEDDESGSDESDESGDSDSS